MSLANTIGIIKLVKSFISTW